MTVHRDKETKSLSYKIDGGILYEIVIGEIGVEEQCGFIREVLSDPALPSPLKVLRDAREQVGLIGDSLKDLQPIISIAKNAFMPAGSRMAIVASDDLVFGMSRVFQARVVTDDVKVFRRLEEAREWLLSEEPAEGWSEWLDLNVTHG